MGTSGGLRVRLLGPVSAERDGDELALPGQKVRQVLAILASNAGRTVPLDRLVDGLWPDDPPPTARKALQVHVSHLRQAVGAEAVVTVDGGYRLVADVDVVAFEAEVAVADRAVGDDPDVALLVLDAALARWRGDPFADLSTESLSAERTRLIELRAHAVELRFETLLALGRHTEVLGDVDRAIAADPFRERLRASQMVALYRDGRQAEALRAYAGAREYLLDELGVDPSPELRALEGRILAQDASLDAPVSDAPVAGSLPARRDDLVGRADDIATVAGLLVDSRLVTLTGVGGCGKTSLALEVAHHAAPTFKRGVWFVDLTRVSDGADVTTATLDAMSMHPLGEHRRLEQLAEFIGPRRTLLVVDNCEHVLDEVAEMVDGLLDRCELLSVLATSREALALSGERSWRVPSLEIDGVESPAVELFVRRATGADSEFGLAIDDEHDVVEICRRLDGIPLAIELAAARVRTMNPAQIRQRLDDRFRLLAGGRRRAAQRQQTLQGAVEWSYDLLTSDEQTMLRRLSVFHDGFDLAHVPDVADFEPDRATDLVDSLVTKSLVDVARTDGAIVRHRLLETIRLFALDKLVAASEAEATRERHYTAFAGSLGSKGEEAVRARRDLLSEIANIKAVVDWLVDTGREREAAITLGHISPQPFWTVNLTQYRPLLEADYDVGPAEACLLLRARTSLVHASSNADRQAAPIGAAARAIATDELLVDLLPALLVEVDYCPAEDSAAQLAFLDDLLERVERVDGSPWHTAIVQQRRAGMLYGLGRLEDVVDALELAVVGLEQSDTDPHFSITGLVAVLVLLGRRDEANALVADGRAGRWARPTAEPWMIDLLDGLAAIGMPRPRESATRIAVAARRVERLNRPFLDASFLTVFAAFRYDLGDQTRANQILETARPQNGMLNWLVWPWVWEWDRSEFVERNAERRRWELQELCSVMERRGEVAAMFDEELSYWLG